MFAAELCSAAMLLLLWAARVVVVLDGCNIGDASDCFVVEILGAGVVVVSVVPIGGCCICRLGSF